MGDNQWPCNLMVLRRVIPDSDPQSERMAALISLYRGNPEMLRTLAEMMEVADWLEAELGAKISNQPNTVN